MATPAEISIASACWNCIPDKLAALLYLLATNAGMSDPATVAANSACWSCVPDKWAAALYLLDNGGSGGGGGGGGTGCALSTNGDPEGVLTATCSPAIAVDPATQAIYLFTGVAGTNTGWALKV